MLLNINDFRFRYGSFFIAQQQLINAAYRGDIQSAEYLLTSENVDPDVKDSTGKTPLMYAALQGHKELIQLLVTLGADINLPDNEDQTAIMHMAFTDNIEMARYLRELGANVNLPDNEGKTALIHASQSPHLEVFYQMNIKTARRGHIF